MAEAGARPWQREGTLIEWGPASPASPLPRSMQQSLRGGSLWSPTGLSRQDNLPTPLLRDLRRLRAPGGGPRPPVQGQGWEAGEGEGGVAGESGGAAWPPPRRPQGGLQQGHRCKAGLSWASKGRRVLQGLTVEELSGQIAGASWGGASAGAGRPAKLSLKAMASKDSPLLKELLSQLESAKEEAPLEALLAVLHLFLHAQPSRPRPLRISICGSIEWQSGCRGPSAAGEGAGVCECGGGVREAADPVLPAGGAAGGPAVHTRRPPPPHRSQGLPRLPSFGRVAQQEWVFQTAGRR